MKKALLILGCISFAPYSIAAASNEQTQNTNTVQLSADHISWSRQPKIRLNNHELGQQSHQIDVMISANEKGEVTQVHITQSSGRPALDRKIVSAVYASKFRPYKHNGVATPITVTQSFSLQPSRTALKHTSAVCTYNFESEVWHKQQSDQRSAFRYNTQPSLRIVPEQLSQQSREIEFSFKLSRQNSISQVEILKSSGVQLMDAQVKYAVSHASITAPRKFWQFYKLKFNDRIYFDIKQCK